MTDFLFYALVVIPALVVAIVFHEVAHGWAALALGDPTAKERRRLSLNPIRHVDPVGTLAVPGLLALTGAPVFGWAKPVPVVQQRLHNPRFGMMAVAAAGPGTNFVLAALAAIALGMLLPTGSHLGLSEAGMLAMLGADGTVSWPGTFGFVLITINVFLGLFNLLPIPPFDGSHIVEGLLPPPAARIYEKLRPFGFPLLFLLLLVIPYFFPQLGIVERVVMPPVQWAIEKYLTLTAWVAGTLF